VWHKDVNASAIAPSSSFHVTVLLNGYPLPRELDPPMPDLDHNYPVAPSTEMIQTAPRPEPEIYARILFRVCATSDYHAQRPEEMSFDEGDMIAVTRFSPTECWWAGLLLDDHRQNNWWEQIPLSDVPNMPDNGLFRRDLTKLP